MIPKTVIRRLNPQPPPQVPAPGEIPGLPQAGRSEQAYGLNPTPFPTRQPTQAPRTVPGKGGLMPNGPIYFIKSVVAILFILALIGGGVLFALQRRAAMRPEAIVTGLAQQYLTSLSNGDYAAAYAMLSQSAQAQSSLDEFRELRDTTPWTWSSISVASVEPDAVMIQYDLSLAGGPPQKDYLLFVQEAGRWVRPYTWGLLKKIEGAFERGDPDMAMLLAQAAVSVDSRDPMARGYLCEAFYYRKVPQSAQKECEEALALIQKYPSKLSLKSLYHLHAILGDTYKNSLRAYDRAADEYSLMLKFPALSAEDQCELLLARADTFSLMGRAPQALSDLAGAAAVCAKPEDQQFIQKRQAELSQPH